MIFSISGYAGSGKDTVGKIIQYKLFMKDAKAYWSFKDWLRGVDYDWVSDHWQIRKWATALRKVAAILLGMDEQFLYTDEFKKMVLPVEWNQIKIGDIAHTNPQFLKGFPYPHSYQMTGRQFLQKLGTDAIRNGLHEQAWINALMSQYRLKRGCPKRCERAEECIEPKWCYNAIYPNWIITDTRFPNELAAVKAAGGVSIRINRYQTIDLHVSETALDNVKFDYTIDNNGTIEELSAKIAEVLKDLKLIA